MWYCIDSRLVSANLTQCFLAVSTAASGTGQWGAKPKVKIIKFPFLKSRNSTSNKTRASSHPRVFKDGLICLGAYNIKIFTQMQVFTTALQVQEEMKNSLPKHKDPHSTFCLQEFNELKNNIQNYVYLSICLKFYGLHSSFLFTHTL